MRLRKKYKLGSTNGTDCTHVKNTEDINSNNFKLLSHSEFHKGNSGYFLWNTVSSKIVFGAENFTEVLNNI